MHEAVQKIGAAADWLAAKLGAVANSIEVVKPDASPIVTSERPSATNTEGRTALSGNVGREETKTISTKFKVDPTALMDMAARVGSVITSISSMEGIAKATLDIANFVGPANTARAIQADLSKGINATANLDIGPFMANAAKMKATMAEMSALSQSLSGIGGRGLATRPAVAASAAQP